MSDIDKDTLSDGVSWAAIGFGAAATLTPRLFEKIYGLEDEGELRVMTRLWGSRTAMIGLAMLGSDGDERRRLLTLAAGMSALDTVVIATAGSEVRSSSRALGSLTSAAFTAAYVVLLND